MNRPALCVCVLDGPARRKRFLHEIAGITRMLEHDLKQAEKAPPSDALTRRLGSEKEVQAKLERHLAETDRRLAELSQTKP